MIIDELRIVGSTQTNVVMEAELKRIAQRAVKQRPGNPRKEGLGQLVYPFDAELAWAAVTYMRTPTRVLWDVYRSKAERLEPLYDELLHDLLEDQRKLWRDGDGISVEARRVETFAAGERQVVGTVKNALIDGAGRRGKRLRVDPERPATRWVARLDENHEMVISTDLGGGSPSQRGWRRESGDAPLRHDSDRSRARGARDATRGTGPRRARAGPRRAAAVRRCRAARDRLRHRHRGARRRA